jgi:hypothetical protein
MRPLTEELPEATLSASVHPVSTMGPTAATSRLARDVLCAALGRIVTPEFSVRLWDGTSLGSSDQAAVRATLVFRSPDVVSDLLLRPSTETWGQAFVEDRIDIEGDLSTVFAMADKLLSPTLGMRQRADLLLKVLWLRARSTRLRRLETMSLGTPGSRARLREAIRFHYDQRGKRERLGFRCPYGACES